MIKFLSQLFYDYRRVSEILDQSKDDYLNVTCLRDSLALLRLFTALRGIAGMKFTEEEVKLLISLITKKPPPSKLGRVLNTL